MPITNSYSKDKCRVVIPLGDPAGIGIEVILKALGSKELPSNIEPILFGCKRSLVIAYTNLLSQGVQSLANPINLEIQNIPIEKKIIPGFPSAETGKASFLWLTEATKYILEGKARALVTAPIAKHAWHEAGHVYPGQTERLAELTKSNYPSMLFTATSPFNGWRLNTLLATTHIPLNAVSKELNPTSFISKLNSLLDFCKRFKKHPKLIVAGLNPHAGEEGYIGSEEIKWMIPIIKEWKKAHPNVQLDGPISPDTCWISAAKAWQKTPNSHSPDGILALYHDQGLIPVKLIAFDRAVNTTLGLPFIRTSPDHGTAFDIAGKGCANEESMLEAIKTAWELSNNY